ncbi:hypothetical protein [Roseomonas gilardii]|nr:hypothetical protein [Roseomonas gilardii]
MALASWLTRGRLRRGGADAKRKGIARRTRPMPDPLWTAPAAAP